MDGSFGALGIAVGAAPLEAWHVRAPHSLARDGDPVDRYSLRCHWLGEGAQRIWSRSCSSRDSQLFFEIGKNIYKAARRQYYSQADMGSFTSVGMGVVLATPGGTAEERISRLEEQLRNVQADLDRQGAEIKSDLKKLETKVVAEEKERKRGDESGNEVLTKTMTGDVQLELVGLIYLIVGIILSSIPQELASWCPWLA